MKPHIFEQLREVQPEDLDAMQHVNNVRYVQWIQDIAEAHWKQQATNAMQQQYIWVVLNHYVEYKQPIFLTDQALLKTHVGEVSGPKYGRTVEIWHTEKNQLCVKAESIWCLLDAQTQRPKRVTDEIRRIFEEIV
ncbi:MAG: thioesterase family protein [Tunicatimonas sp.]|uniref:acyl-CoA thioesterase n=1 Tax=Tunicatimonas sp. TaxID=1940096 RepID=UPI003C7489D3